MRPLNELFDVSYGNKLDMNKMKLMPRSKGGIIFVGRSSRNQGVTGVVAPIRGCAPYDPGFITVALGGTRVLASFVQKDRFYTAQNVAVLKPKEDMNFAEKLWVCLCIRHNRFRYSAFGREANRTLKSLLVPEPSEFPPWVSAVAQDLSPAKMAVSKRAATPLELDPSKWGWFRLDSLFDIKKGKRLTRGDMRVGATPFIGAVDKNNGLTAFVDKAPIHPAGTLTVNYNGNGVAEAFYQPKPFWCSDDVNVLYPKFAMTTEIGLFIATLIRLEKYRFNFGRKWHVERMAQSEVRLPCGVDGAAPDWEFMQAFIESLPYSSQL